jgi:hypothetical protein
VEVERRAVEEEIALLVDNDGNTVLLALRIGLGIPGGVEPERILKAAAAATPTRSTVAGSSFCSAMIFFTSPAAFSVSMTDMA